jgi:hypothetical protein
MLKLVINPLTDTTCFCKKDENHATIEIEGFQWRALRESNARPTDYESEGLLILSFIIMC